MSYIGVDAFRAYRVMMTLIRSLWFIEDARTKCANDIKKEIKDQKFEDLVNWFNNLSEDEQKLFFRIAILFGAQLDEEDMLAVLRFRKDKNGIAISRQNINNLSVKEIVDNISDVCLELNKEKVFF